MTAAKTTIFGHDMSTWAEAGQTVPDLDPSFALIEEMDARTIAEACARRLQWPHGMHEDAPEDGFDLRTWINRKWTRQTLFEAQTRIERECEKDERVVRAHCKLTFNHLDRSLVVSLQLETIVSSRFDLVLAVDQVSVSVLTSGTTT